MSTWLEAPLRPGDRVGSYVVEVGLGAGSMASVFRARHVERGTVHALKLVGLPLGVLRRRLWREGEVHARVVHPNVVQIEDMLLHEGSPVLVLEYVDGPNLDDLLAEGPPPLWLVDALVRDLLCGVGAIHAAGIVHRDLKPANVLLEPLPGRGWRARIGDFGIARPADGPGLTRGPGPLGTPRYMAPEQWRDARAVDARADVFSIGCILYEMLADRFPFPGDPHVVRERICAGSYTPLSAFRAVPPSMAAAVHRCLSVDPDRRPPDCDALLALWMGTVDDIEDPPSTMSWGSAMLARLTGREAPARSAVPRPTRAARCRS